MRSNAQIVYTTRKKIQISELVSWVSLFFFFYSIYIMSFYANKIVMTLNTPFYSVPHKSNRTLNLSTLKAIHSHIWKILKPIWYKTNLIKTYGTSLTAMPSLQGTCRVGPWVSGEECSHSLEEEWREDCLFPRPRPAYWGGADWGLWKPGLN